MPEPTSDRSAAALLAGTPAQELWQFWRQGRQPDVRAFLARAGELTSAQVAAVLLVDQRERWQIGERIAAEAYLNLLPHLCDDFDYALELIYGEYLLCEERGERPDLQAYLRRFPAFADRLKLQVELHRAVQPSCPSTPSAENGGPRLTADSGAPPAAGTSWPAVPGYEILGELGRGGMGVVYRAYDRKRREPVAVKTLQGVDPAALYRLKQEFRALADVAHPNLVSFYELLSDGQQCFLTMELVEGVNFLAHARAGAGAADVQTVDDLPAAPAPETVDVPAQANPLSYPGRLRDALRQLASGVDGLHRLGKLHRDIKPNNVLVTKQGRVVLLDFGLAAELDRAGRHQSTEHHIAGTVAYMSPEQAAGEPLSAASDWYSVGVMLYEALTGKRPFCGRPFQIMNDKQQREPPAPQMLAPDVPADLDELCVALLRRSPSARPDGAAVLRCLGGAAAAGPASLPAAPRTTFIGREPHLAALRDAFAEVGHGRPVTLFVHGRSGAGKSLLAQHFLHGLIERGEAVVLAGKCYERESVPYKALDGLVDALSRYLQRMSPLEAQALLPREIHVLARVFPVLQRVQAVAAAPGRAPEIVDPTESWHRAFAALRELLARLGDRRPLILFIDDLQWGDVDSATELALLLRPPDPPALLLLGCYREEDAATSACLRLLLQPKERTQPTEVRRELTVEPLTAAEAQTLVLALLGQDDTAARAQAVAIAREANGNPFFVEVLVQGLTAGAEWEERAAAGDLTLDQVLWERVLTLPAAARRLLETIAVSGQPLPQADAWQAAGLSREDPGTLTLLRSSRLIRSSGPAEREEVETYHDRVRESILANLAPLERKEHHRCLALTLETSAAPEPQDARRIFDLAYHFDAAGDSARALPYALAAAEQSRSQHALRIAEQHYRIAERGVADQATRYRVAEGLGDVLRLSGQFEESGRRLRAARSLAGDDFARAHVESRLAELTFERGELKETAEAVERALHLLGLTVPRRPITFFLLTAWEGLIQVLHTYIPRLFVGRRPLSGGAADLLAARLYSRLGYAYWFQRSPIAVLWTHLRHLNLAERYPPTRELAQAYSQHGPAMTLFGLLRRGIAYVEKSLAMRRAFGDLWGQGQSLHFYGVVLFAASRFTECVAKCREALQILELKGDPWEVSSAHYNIAASLCRLGDFRGALAEARHYYETARAVAASKRSGQALGFWAIASGGRVPPEILRAELETTRAELETTSEVTQRGASVLLAEALRLLAEDCPAEAVAVLEQAVARIEKAGMRNQYVTSLYPWLATASRRAADAPDCSAAPRKLLLRRAQAVARRGLRLAQRFQNDLPHALRENALLAALRGRSRRARKYLDESLAIAERQGARYEYAQTLLARGEIGLKFGWPGAAAEAEAARQSLHAFESARSAGVGEGNA